ncbi:hypothetical protein LB941_09035 [Ligilactobacillus sp. WILCCON 0076]|uniref:Sugar phosphate isomerase/epimerase n=1 Tax=Ligilactobacillus ubinensis TaxID=2876789 RepID=A0A9X2FLC1_9LACO|nr:hypothetical protein [Ligilactobacillus ubinensis]MCP0887480.1 hypothetical protein [Ligilactobacillus ubinensis]
MEFILNTIAFKDCLDSGTSQAELVESVASLGFDAIEIRNEFLSGDPSELSKIAFNAQKAHLNVYYSINDTLFSSGKLNQNLPRYIEELKLLGSKHLKINIGSLPSSSKFNLKNELAPYINDIEINVENNQSYADSNLNTTTTFLKLVENEKIQNVNYCFDIANWKWLDTSVYDAITSLKDVTNYLHLKNVTDDLQVTSLEQGNLDWRKILTKFNTEKITKVALEYANDQEHLASDLQLLQNFFNRKELS